MSYISYLISSAVHKERVLVSTNSIARKKSIAFALRIVKLSQYLVREHNEYVLSKQVLRSGTSIGANITEAIYGSSQKDFIAKLQIAKKESAETLYWLELLNGAGYLDGPLYQSLQKDCDELLSILVAAIRSSAQP